MREIKFRAWCEGNHDNMTFSNPHMEYDVVLVDGKYASVEGGWDIQGSYPTVPLMQYTGLKDKNGKGIYEGDIVRAVFYQNIDVVQTVMYNSKRGCFSLMREPNASYYKNLCEVDNDTRQNIEVIGNIYENPELINN